MVVNGFHNLCHYIEVPHVNAGDSTSDGQIQKRKEQLAWIMFIFKGNIRSIVLWIISSRK